MNYSIGDSFFFKFILFVFILFLKVICKSPAGSALNISAQCTPRASLNVEKTIQRENKSRSESIIEEDLTYDTLSNRIESRSPSPILSLRPQHLNLPNQVYQHDAPEHTNWNFDENQMNEYETNNQAMNEYNNYNNNTYNGDYVQYNHGGNYNEMEYNNGQVNNQEYSNNFYFENDNNNYVNHQQAGEYGQNFDYSNFNEYQGNGYQNYHSAMGQQRDTYVTYPNEVVNLVRNNPNQSYQYVRESRPSKRDSQEDWL